MKSEEKRQYNIYNWSIQKGLSDDNIKFNYLMGMTFRHHQKKLITTSKILNIDFVEGIAETKNSFYVLKDGDFEEEE